MFRIFRLVLLLGLAGCADEMPARLSVATGDTIVLNSRSLVQMPVRVHDAAGRTLTSRPLRYQRLSGGDIQLSENGQARCVRSEDAEVLVSLGSLSSRIVLLCRPIRALRYAAPVELVLGGPPGELTIEAVGLDGSRVTEIAGAASVRDTLIVGIRDGRLHPRTRGRTSVDLDLGDCSTSVEVRVIERRDGPAELQPHQEFFSRLTLVSGEIRSWRVGRGRYELTFEPDSTSGERLTFGAVGMDCAAFPDAAQHYSCVARPGALVVVRHPGQTRRRSKLSGRLFLRRLEDPAAETAPTRLGMVAQAEAVPQRSTGRDRQCPVLIG